MNTTNFLKGVQPGPMHDPFGITTTKAMTLIDELLKLSVVSRIEVFGSVAREQVHDKSDLDLILCVDQSLVYRWIEGVDEALRLYAAHGHKGVSYSFAGAHFRRECAMGLLELTNRTLWGSNISPNRVDIFMFTVDWREHLDELQRLGRHRDPNFMRNIARDAKVYVRGFMTPH